MSDEIFQSYGIHRWSQGMFARMENGDLGIVNPARPDAPPAGLPELLHALDARGIHTPVLVRVGAFLRRQIEALNAAFAKAIAANDYNAPYRGVFPIKVNQQAEVIDRIVEYGQPFQFGLEAGSKPELILALSRDLPKGALLICNGIKDAEFIRLGILARKAGINCVLVIESPAEADTVIAEAKRLGEMPALGVRIKLTRRVTGNWADSSGDRSTFGLTTKEVVDLVEKLRAADMLDCLVLQHAHLGSRCRRSSISVRPWTKPAASIPSCAALACRCNISIWAGAWASITRARREPRKTPSTTRWGNIARTSSRQ